jgi:hypothetical protein
MGPAWLRCFIGSGQRVNGPRHHLERAGGWVHRVLTRAVVPVQNTHTIINLQDSAADPASARSSLHLKRASESVRAATSSL